MKFKKVNVGKNPDIFYSSRARKVPSLQLGI